MKTAPLSGSMASNLRSRILSAVVMAAAALGLLWLGPEFFGVLVLALAVVMAWEWSRIVRGVSADIAFYAHAIAVGAATAFSAFGAPVTALLFLGVGAAITGIMSWRNRPLLSALGVVYVGAPAIALLWMRADIDLGIAAVLFLLGVVWAGDTMAFAAGRLLGGPKLWPAISPNKTWSGFAGAVIGGGVVAALFVLLIEGTSLVWLVPLGLLLGAVGQGGDLAESALKRGFGVKDSSGIIPGHGGAMDRLDSMVAVITVAAVVALASNIARPAHALFFGW